MSRWGAIEERMYRRVADGAGGGTGEAGTELESNDPVTTDEGSPFDGEDLGTDAGDGSGAGADGTTQDTRQAEGEQAAGDTTARSGAPDAAAEERITTLLNRLNTVESELAKFRPSEPDPLDAVLEQLPQGAEGSQERQLYEDAKLLAPALKALRPALMRETHAVLAGVTQALSRMRFEVEQIRGLIPPGKLPPGLRHLDRVEEFRRQVFEQSGGKRLIGHGDAFAELQKQLAAEGTSATTREAQIRQDERTRVAREAQARRAASGAGGPGNTAPARRTGVPAGPRSFADLDRAASEGANLVIP